MWTECWSIATVPSVVQKWATLISKLPLFSGSHDHQIRDLFVSSGKLSLFMFFFLGFYKYWEDRKENRFSQVISGSLGLLMSKRRSLQQSHLQPLRKGADFEVYISFYPLVGVLLFHGSYSFFSLKKKKQHFIQDLNKEQTGGDFFGKNG